MKAWVLDKWKTFRADQKRQRQRTGLTVVGRFVWRRGGEIELLATFADNETAIKTITDAGYTSRADGSFKP